MAPDELKLECLLYYAQAWHLALHDVPLFDDPIVAADHGPELESGLAFQRLQTTLSPMNWEHFDKVIRRYANFNPDALARRVRSEPPWILARERTLLEPRLIIRHDDMRLFYRYGSQDLVTRASLALCRVSANFSLLGSDLRPY